MTTHLNPRHRTPLGTGLRVLATLLPAALVLFTASACSDRPSEDAPGDMQGALGTWGEEGPRSPHLVLGADGKLSGSDGCNRLVGQWQQDGERVSFSQVASTRMYCEGVDTWLSGLATAIVNGDSLTVFDAGGAEIGALDRAIGDES